MNYRKIFLLSINLILSFIAGGELLAKTFVVSVEFADIRRHKSDTAELLTQVLYGDSVRIVREDTGWCFVEIGSQKDFREGRLVPYQGWIKKSSIKELPVGYEGDNWFKKSVILADSKSSTGIAIRSKPVHSSAVLIVVCDGVMLPGSKVRDNWFRIVLPTGITGYVDKEKVIVPGVISNDDLGKKFVLHAMKLYGKKYLWGGLSVAGVDCSGLVYLASRSTGFLIPRDTFPQFVTLATVDPKFLKKGDVVYFDSAGQKAGHVALYMGDDNWLHASRDGVTHFTMKQSDFIQHSVCGIRRIFQ